MSLQDQEGWKNQERAYEQGLNVGKKFAQNKVLKLLDEVIAEFESQSPKTLISLATIGNNGKLK